MTCGRGLCLPQPATFFDSHRTAFACWSFWCGAASARIRSASTRSAAAFGSELCGVATCLFCCVSIVVVRCVLCVLSGSASTDPVLSEDRRGQGLTADSACNADRIRFKRRVQITADACRLSQLRACFHPIRSADACVCTGGSALRVCACCCCQCFDLIVRLFAAQLLHAVLTDCDGNRG